VGQCVKFSVVREFCCENIILAMQFLISNFLLKNFKSQNFLEYFKFFLKIEKSRDFSKIKQKSNLKQFQSGIEKSPKIELRKV
jgi:hypothetical protein